MWGAVKGWWSKYNWHAILALSNCVLAAGVIGVYSTHKDADQALNAQETYNYIKLWNSPLMLRQRRTLARSLRNFDESGSGIRRHGPPPTTCELPKNEHGEETLNPDYLNRLYRGPDPFTERARITEDSAKFSAFETVRSFFEQLGSAYRGPRLDEHTAFEAFSLPAETYWSVAVSGWLDNWIRLKKLDPTVGTEFAYFECTVEKIEGKTDPPMPPSEYRLVLDQDANLPVEGGGDPESASPQPRGEAIFGPRVPTDYFVTKGSGESDEGIPPDPYETFSYDLALQKAAIEDFNVVTYTSVLPPEAREVTLEKVKPTFHHGAVLEVIMAKIGGVKNQTVCAGIGRAWALNSAGNSVGGYAAEYQYKYDNRDLVAVGEREAKAQLTASLNHELFIRGLKQDGQMKFDVECLSIGKKYGMALAAIGFVKFVYPEAKALAR